MSLILKIRSNIITIVVFANAIVASHAIALSQEGSQANGKLNSASSWTTWRGPTQNGVAHPDANPPIEWSETKNVKWKVPLFGLGHSTPAVWGDLVFVTSAEAYGEKFAPIPETAPGAHDNSAVEQKHRFWVTAVNRSNGKVLWRTKVNDLIPHEGGHFTGSLASASPSTDGQFVFAFFGSHGLYCLDFKGKIIWKKNLGKMNSKHAHGEGSTPALFEQTLVVNWDHQGQSFVIAIDTQTGKTIWKTDRNEVTSWSSPVIVKVDGKPQVIVPGTNRTRGYDLKSGKVVWECGGLSNNVVASPVFDRGIVYVGSSYEKQAFQAIKITGATGDLTGTDHVLWFRKRHTPYVPSPLLFKDTLYFFRHYQGILCRVDGPSGKEKDPVRLIGITNIYGSPIAAANRVYIADRGGSTIVLEHGEVLKTRSLNRLNDSFNASPVAVNKQLILRGEKSLYVLENEKE